MSGLEMSGFAELAKPSMSRPVSKVRRHVLIGIDVERPLRPFDRRRAGEESTCSAVAFELTERVQIGPGEHRRRTESPVVGRAHAPLLARKGVQQVAQVNLRQVDLIAQREKKTIARDGLGPRGRYPNGRGDSLLPLVISEDDDPEVEARRRDPIRVRSDDEPNGIAPAPESPTERAPDERLSVDLDELLWPSEPGRAPSGENDARDPHSAALS